MFPELAMKVIEGTGSLVALSSLVDPLSTTMSSNVTPCVWSQIDDSALAVVSPAFQLTVTIDTSHACDFTME